MKNYFLKIYLITIFSISDQPLVGTAHICNPPPPEPDKEKKWETVCNLYLFNFQSYGKK